MRLSERTRSRIFDAAVSIGIVLLSLPTMFRAHFLVLAVLMGAALLVRRRWPLAVMGVVATLAFIQVLLTTKPYSDPLPFDLAVLVALYSVVKYGARLADAYLAAAVVAVGIAVEVSRHPGPTWFYEMLFYTAICGGVWLSGYIVRTRRFYVAGLEERAATLEREQEHLTAIAVAHERAAIAREMHDVVAHSLAVIIVQSDGGRYAMAADPETGKAVLETVAGTARDALEEMGRLIDLLRGSDDGVLEGDRRVWGLDSMSTLVDRAHAAGLDVTARINPVPLATNSTVGVAAYRLVQEALTNTLRHAGPGTVSTITVTGDEDTLVITAVDDGAGHTTAGTPPGRVGHGLVGMRERVALFGGRLAAGPRPGGGWSMRAELPIPAWERVPADLTVAS